MHRSIMLPLPLLFPLLSATTLAQEAAIGPCPEAWVPRNSTTWAVHPPGNDTRIEIEECNDPAVAKNADTVVALFDKDNENYEGSAYRAVIRSRTPLKYEAWLLDNETGGSVPARICPDELFQTQTRAAGCTGVIVPPELVLTAGHCVSGSEPEDILLLLDYKMEGGQPPSLEVDPDDPRRLVVDSIIQYSGSDLEPDDSWRSVIRGDFALLSLVDSVYPSRVAEVNLDSGDALTGDMLYILGFPKGHPMKLGPNGRVHDSLYYNADQDTGSMTAKDFIFTDLPAFSGNSGSPVFNAQTHVLEGILVSGQDDFVLHKTEACATSRCAEGVAGCTRREAVGRYRAMPAAMRTMVDQARASLSSEDPKEGKVEPKE